jgi:hypothetical protein
VRREMSIIVIKIAPSEVSRNMYTPIAEQFVRENLMGYKVYPGIEVSEVGEDAAE